MLRILVAVFFWLCAVGVLALSIRAEIIDARKPMPRPVDHTKLSAHSGHPAR